LCRDGGREERDHRARGEEDPDRQLCSPPLDE
jgi:hypothetical protein